jgi:hypothetical protein
MKNDLLECLVGVGDRKLNAIVGDDRGSLVRDDR